MKGRSILVLLGAVCLALVLPVWQTIVTAQSDAPARQISQPIPQQLAVSMPNPAVVYCEKLGYQSSIEKDPAGEHGICSFPDGTSCDSWDFLRGTCGQQYSYCAKLGYGIQTVHDGGNPFSPDYAVCVSTTGAVMGDPLVLSGLSSELAATSSLNVNEGLSITQEPPITEGEPLVSVPPSFDWRNYNGANWMTGVRNQGGCGSCWAFAAVGVVEAIFNISTNNPELDLDLAEQYLVSTCAHGGSCAGGSSEDALNFIRDTGIPDENCMPYTGQNMQCSARCSDWGNRLVRITSSSSAFSVDAQTIKAMLVSKGPLAVYMGIVGFGGYFDENNIYRCTNDSGIDHAVVLTGYDDVGGYWIIKNSWGTSWGENGYFKVGYGECSLENYTYAQVSPAPPPTNDDFGASTTIDSLPYQNSQSTESATVATDDPGFSCVADQGYNTVWYKYTPTTSGKLRVSTMGSNYDTVLAVWTGIPGALQSEACHDNWNEFYQSELDVVVNSGVTYYIEIAGFYSSSYGTLNLSVQQWSPNDDINAATIITSLPYRNSQLTIGATVAADDPTFSCVAGQGYNTVWYKFIPSTSGLIKINTFDSHYDTVLAVWTGTPGAFLSQACNNNWEGSGWSYVEAMVIAGTTYYIEVAGYAPTDYGILNLYVPEPAPNDKIEAATAIESVPYKNLQNTDGATVAANDPIFSCIPVQGSHTVWYKYTPAVNETLRLSTANSRYDTLLAVWTGVPGALQSEACNDDWETLGQSQLDVAVSAGTTYYIEIAGYRPNSSGNLNLSISPLSVPNDNFDWAEVIPADLPYYHSQSIEEATTATDDPLLPCIPGQRNRSVWFKYTASSSGGLVISTATSEYDTVLAVWTGVRGALVNQACNDNWGETETSRLSVEVFAGTTYFIEVASNTPDLYGTLNLSIVSTISNDDFDAATVITTLPYQNSQSTEGATSAADDPPIYCLSQQKLYNTVWYKYVPPNNQTLKINTANSDYDTVLVVWHENAGGGLSMRGCNNDANGTIQSEVDVAVIAGEDYYIEIAGYYPEAYGTLNLYVAPTVPNDDFDSAIDITTLPYRNWQALIKASVAADDPILPCASGQGYNTLWYKYTPASSGRVIITTYASDYNTVLAAWTGTRGALQSQGCSDDWGGYSYGQLNIAVVPGTTYYIEVASYSDDAYGIMNLWLLPPVKLVEPSDKAYLRDNTPLFRWEAVNEAEFYQLEVDNSSSFSSPEISVQPTATTYTPSTALNDGKYYWRVRHYNINGIWGPWSAPRSFTVDTIVPSRPVLLSPANGASTTDHTPTLRWNAVAGATKYRVQVDNNSDFSSPTINRSQSTTVYTPSSALSNSTYYWRVSAQDPAGNVSAWSTRWSFRVTGSAAIPPADISATGTFTPTPEPTATPTPTVMPTKAIDTLTPTPTEVISLPLLRVESDQPVVQQSGIWTAHTTDLASGGSYLFSSGGFEDVLSLNFIGTQLEVIYVKHPALGTFAVEIDGTVLQIVNSVAVQSEFGVITIISGLANGPHTARIYPVDGVIALDAFGVEALPDVMPSSTPLPTDMPTQDMTPTALPSEQPTVTPTQTSTDIATVTDVPTSTPDLTNTPLPTDQPTATPIPTDVPPTTPTAPPSVTPTELPPAVPSATPTDIPTEEPPVPESTESPTS